MDANTANSGRLKALITLAAVLIALAHLIWPNLSIDGITVTLLFIALAPWLSPIFKSLQFPGGWKIEFQEIKERMNSIIASTTEPIAGRAAVQLLFCKLAEGSFIELRSWGGSA